MWTARSRSERRTGLLGTDGIDGAVWITRCSWVHCWGMRYPIDVVYVARSGEVLAVAPLAPGRVGLPRPRAAAVVEMAQGEAARLGVVPGAVLSSLVLADPAGAVDPAGPSGAADAARDGGAAGCGGSTARVL